VHSPAAILHTSGRIGVDADAAWFHVAVHTPASRVDAALTPHSRELSELICAAGDPRKSIEKIYAGPIDRRGDER
jgi:hypothetical protein